MSELANSSEELAEQPNVPTIEGLVSTIIPVYNRPEMIHTAVNSVLEQSYRPIEIILINDGSTDNTAEILDHLKSLHPEEIKVLHRDNGGPGLAREAGRLIARGEFIQYLDSDDWLLPNKFQDQVTALRHNPECGIAYGITRLVNENGEILKEPSKQTGEIKEHLFPALLVDRWWHTHTPLYKRDVSDAAGAWPKQRPEDWDLEARMGANKTRLIHCGTVVSCHRDHPSDNRVTKGSQKAYLRDEAWFLPRLYECAKGADVPADAVEMHHLSRWAFMRARHLAHQGDKELASNILDLAMATSIKRGVTDISLFRVFKNIFGWKLTGYLSYALEKIR